MTGGQLKSSWNLTTVLATVHSYDEALLFKMYVGADEKKSSVNIIKVGRSLIIYSIK